MRQSQRVAGEVGMPVHLFTLVMVTENHQALTEDVFGRSDTSVALAIVEQAELVNLELGGHSDSPVKGWRILRHEYRDYSQVRSETAGLRSTVNVTGAMSSLISVETTAVLLVMA